MYEEYEKRLVKLQENELTYQHEIERITEERDYLSNLQQSPSKPVQIDVGIQTANDLDL